MIGIKRLVAASVLLTLASLALAQTSYDAITGQSFSSYYSPGAEGVPFADDTTLANLDPISSVDVGLYNPASASTTSYSLTLSIYDTDPSSGGPGNLLETETGSVSIPVNSAPLVTFSFSTPWVPTTEDLWTGLTITGGPDLGWLIPDGAPTVGSSQDVFAEYDSGSWGAYFFNGNPVANFAIRYNTVPAVPEPAPMAVLGLGLVGLVIRRRKR